MATGVYEIVCLPTGKRYVGSAAISFAKRFAQHRHELHQGRHRSTYMQRSWDKYGEQAFKFSMLEECEPQLCVEREQVWIDRLNPKFNTAKVAGSSLGIKRSEDVRRANGERAKARNLAAPGRNVAHLTELVRTPEFRAAQAQRLREAHMAGKYASAQAARAEARSRRFLVAGESLTLKQLAVKYGRTVKALARRVERGASGDDIVAPPYHMRRKHGAVT